MISLSVCLIVKNEEKNIGRCLKCVKSFADEIVVIDTGSTDKTLSIAKDLGAKTYKIWWQNDFSKARNFSFSKAKSDYILWLDADDIITKENQEKIISLKNNLDKNVDMVMFKYVNSPPEEKETSYFLRERIIKNFKNFRWQGFVHEVIPLAGNIKIENISIHHAKEKQEKYSTRNLDIYENAITKNKKFSNRDFYYYGRELFYHKKFTKAISILKKFTRLEKNNLADLFEANMLIGNCYAQKNNPNKALEFYLKNLNFALPSSKLLCKIGDVFLLQKNYKNAIYYYNLATLSTIDNEIFIEQQYKNLIPYLQLCVCYFKLGNIEKAKYYNSLAENISANNPSVIHNKKFFNQQKNL